MDKRKLQRLTIVKDEIIVGYKNGMTLVELGKLHTCAPGTIRNLLMEAGVERRKRGRKKNVDTTQNVVVSTESQQSS